MSIAIILIIMALIFTISTVIGAIRGLTIDDRSHALGALAGAYIGGNLALLTGGVLVAIHFISKGW